MTIAQLRQNYHQQICLKIIRTVKGYPNFADKSSKSSRKIAEGIIEHLGFPIGEEHVHEQTVGDLFESITKDFLEQAFQSLQHLRPGEWHYSTVQTEISRFEQYEHLAHIAKVIIGDKIFAAALGGDYFIKPDIIVGRRPVSDAFINQNEEILRSEDDVANLTPLRSSNRPDPRMLLHASISCKWTIRSDRSQNTRTEALNLIRNRKGPLPHIAAVTAEPLPTRIAALALGTGDLDCVYHFALPELKAVLGENDYEDHLDLLNMMIDGRRLRDISDLPFDLAI